MSKPVFNFDMLTGEEFTTIDGRTLKVKDYFNEKDFVLNKESCIFVRHNSLLRVLKKLFVIVRYNACINNVPMKDNEWCATVSVCYEIIPRNEVGIPDQKFSWNSVADCNKINSMPGFEKYTTVVAETRASARALRNILGLDVCSKEEITDQTQDIEPDLPIQGNQRVLLETKFIGEMKVTLVEMGEIIGKIINTLDDLKKSEAATIIEKLNSKRSKKKEGGNGN